MMSTPAISRLPATSSRRWWRRPLIAAMVLVLTAAHHGGNRAASAADEIAPPCAPPEGNLDHGAESESRPAYCGPAPADGRDGIDGQGSSHDLAIGPLAPVEGYFAALLDRRIDDLAGYVCDDLSWHSILGSPTYGIDPVAWWKVLEFSAAGGLDIRLKPLAGDELSAVDEDGAAATEQGSDGIVDKYELERQLQKDRETSGADKEVEGTGTGRPDAAGKKRSRLESVADADKKPYRPFDPDKAPVVPDTSAEPAKDSEPAKDFEPAMDFEAAKDSEPAKEFEPFGATADAASFDPDKAPAEPFDPDKAPAEPFDPDKAPAEPFDPDKAAIEDRAIVQVKGAMVVSVSDIDGLKRQIRRSLRDRLGEAPSRTAVDLAVAELARGTRFSLTQDVPVSLIDGRWLICGEDVGVPDLGSTDAGDGARRTDGGARIGKRRG